MNTFHWVAVVATIIMSSARITRLATYDKFPPTLALRNRYADWTEDPKHPGRFKWQLLAFCGYCFSFWATVFVVASADLCGLFDGAPAWDADWLTTLWWFVFGTLGASYAAAIVMAHDGDVNEDDD